MVRFEFKITNLNKNMLTRTGKSVKHRFFLKDC